MRLRLILFLLIVWIIIVGCQSKSDLPQTDGNTYCNSNKDCWCRVFNGAQFLPGKGLSECNLETKRCYPCLYK